jgi:hypothetical protein
LRIILIELCSDGGFPLKEASEHCFLSIKVLFWCCGPIYYVFHCYITFLDCYSAGIPAIFLFFSIIIDLVPNKWYQRNFHGSICGLIFFPGYIHALVSLSFIDTYLGQGSIHIHHVLKITLLDTLVTPIGTTLSGFTLDNTCIWTCASMYLLYIKIPPNYHETDHKSINQLPECYSGTENNTQKDTH